MMRLSSVKQRYLAGSSRSKISYDSARDFIYMVEHGISIDTIIELMNCNDTEGDGWKFRLTKKLIGNPLIRQNELFCVLLGVKSIKPKSANGKKILTLVEISEHKRMSHCITELEIEGYKKTSKGYETRKYEKDGFVAYAKNICSNRWEITKYEVIYG